MLRRKIATSIVAGFLYWDLSYVVLRVGNVRSDLELLSVVLMFIILPLIIGALLLLFLKEKRYSGIIYCIIFVLVHEAILLVWDIVFLSKEYDVVKEALIRFKHVGSFALLFSTIGGLGAICINRKR